MPITIALDALFTPVRSAQYLSEPARVGQDAKYDKVHIEVETMERSARCRQSARLLALWSIIWMH